MLLAACVERLIKNPALRVFSIDRSDWRRDETGIDALLADIICQSCQPLMFRLSKAPYERHRSLALVFHLETPIQYHRRS